MITLRLILAAMRAHRWVMVDLTCYLLQLVQAAVASSRNEAIPALIFGIGAGASAFLAYFQFRYDSGWNPFL